VLAEIDGIADRTAAELLRGLHIYIDAAEVELDEDEYLWSDLVGCTVVTDEGQQLGAVVGLQDYGAQELLAVASNHPAGEWLLPFIEDVILAVDLPARRIEVHLLPGMDACFTPRS